MDASYAKTELGRNRCWSMGLSPWSSVHMNLNPLPLTLRIECNSSPSIDWFLPKPGLPTGHWLSPGITHNLSLVSWPLSLILKKTILKTCLGRPLGWSRPGLRWEMANELQPGEEKPPRSTYSLPSKRNQTKNKSPPFSDSCDSLLSACLGFFSHTLCHMMRKSSGPSPIKHTSKVRYRNSQRMSRISIFHLIPVVFGESHSVCNPSFLWDPFLS